MEDWSEVAALIATAILLGVVVFQILLVQGKPWGHLAWGGQHRGVLPKNLRIGSAISALLLLGFASIILDAGGIRDSLLSDTAVDIAKWVVFGFFVLGTLMNAASRSKPERNLWTPVNLVLAILTFIVANGS
ncbi:MAG: hypothetical protein R3313_03060 [Candidatus Saccharimonadales bacterium]|nr:hypothetical protein [Candidatus Saccharimonadales bacterium]